jgi:hypothetical protein
LGQLLEQLSRHDDAVEREEDVADVDVVVDVHEQQQQLSLASSDECDDIDDVTNGGRWILTSPTLFSASVFVERFFCSFRATYLALFSNF